MSQRSQRLLHIDLLRALSVLFIIAIWHLDDYANDCMFTCVTEFMAHASLNLFVFISSYLLSRKNEFATYRESYAFIVSRLIRIYPLYLISLLLFYFMSDISITTMITQATVTNMILGQSVNTLWFVGMIFNFYLLLALILRRYSLKKALATFAISIILLSTAYTATNLVDAKIILYLPSFIAGVLYAKHRRIRLTLSNTYLCLLFVTLIIIYLTRINGPLGATRVSVLLLFSMAFLSIFPLVRFTQIINSITNVAARSIISVISYASFGMYLFHRVVFAVLLSLYKPSSELSVLYYLWLGGLPAVFILSYCIQYMYDSVATQASISHRRRVPRS